MIQAETTPNPATLKFKMSQAIATDSADFKDAEDTHRSPLATKLFGFPWVDGVFVGQDFVTVTKQDWVEWDMLVEPLKGLIQEHLNSGVAVLLDEKTVADATAPGDETAEMATIRRVLEEEVRPAVQMDGGDVTLVKYENGVVYLSMRGSCSGCPSSEMTLKMGIETRLKEAVPSVQEVVAI